MEAAKKSANSSDDSQDEMPTAQHPKTNGTQQASNQDSDEEEDDYATHDEILNRIVDDSTDPVTTATADLDLEDTPAASGADTPSSQPKLGKAKQKRAKKAAQTTEDKSGSVAGASCVVCGAQFGSKTKLFAHINKEGHAAPISQTKVTGGIKGQKSKKKK